MESEVSDRSHLLSGKSDHRSEISNAAEAASLVRLAAEPRVIGDSVKTAITRASRKLGWSRTRTRDIWYGVARRIDAREMDVLRVLARKRSEDAGRAEANKVIEQLAALRARLAARDQDFHREDIAALEFALGRMGFGVRSVVIPDGD